MVQRTKPGSSTMLNASSATDRWHGLTTTYGATLSPGLTSATRPRCSYGPRRAWDSPNRTYGGWRPSGARSQTRTISTDHLVWAIIRRPLNRTYRCLFVSSAGFWGCSGRDRSALPWSGVGRRVGLGPGSDLSEEPVYQGVSRPRWNQRRPWVSSRTQPLCQLLWRRASARRRR